MSIVIAYKSKPTIEQVQKAMLKAASKHMQDIKYSSNALPPMPLAFVKRLEAKDLLDQTAVAAQTTAAHAATSGETQAKVAVLQFDQYTGALLHEQVTFENQAEAKNAPIEVPWRIGTMNIWMWDRQWQTKPQISPCFRIDIGDGMCLQ